MLTFIQRRVLFLFPVRLILWTSVCSDAERLFHQRDHSDLHSPNQQRAEPIADSYTAEMFLSRYGFLKPVVWEETLLDDREETDFSFFDLSDFSIEEGASSPHSRNADPSAHDDQKLHDPQFISALRDFQRLSGLSVTGLFDEATKAAMNKPRCGVPDVEVELGAEENMDEGKNENLDKKTPEDKHLDDTGLEDENLDDKIFEDEHSNGENFEDEYLEDKNMERRNFEEKKMDDKNIEDTKLDKKTPEEKYLDDTRLEDENLDGNILEEKKLLDKNKNKTNLEDKNIENTYFEDIIPEDKNIEDKNLDKKTLEDKKVNETNLEDKNLGDENVEIKISDNKILKMNDENFEDECLEDKNMDQTNFEDENLDGKILEDEHLKDKNMNKTNSEDKNLEDESFEEKIKDKNMNKTILEHKNIENTDIRLEDKNIEDKKLDDKKVNDTTLEDKNVNDTKFEDKNLGDKNVGIKILDYKILEDEQLNDENFEDRLEDKNMHKINFEDKNLDDKNVEIFDTNFEDKSFDGINFESESFEEENLDEKQLKDEHLRHIFDSKTSKDEDNNLEDEKLAHFKMENVHKNLEGHNKNTKSYLNNFSNNILLNLIKKSTENSTFFSLLFENETAHNNSYGEFSGDFFSGSGDTVTFDSKTNDFLQDDESDKNKNHNHIFDERTNRENFTFDGLNLEMLNETNWNFLTILDQIDNATIENTQQKNMDITGFETMQNSTIGHLNFNNYTNETNLDIFKSSTIFDSIENDTSVENGHQNLYRTVAENEENSDIGRLNLRNFINESNLNYSTIFAQIINNNVVDLNITDESKEDFTVSNGNISHFTNETNFNSSTIFDPINNDTTVETKPQTVALKPETEEAQSSKLSRRKRHLAALVSRSRREAAGHVSRSRREAAGHTSRSRREAAGHLSRSRREAAGHVSRSRREAAGHTSRSRREAAGHLSRSRRGAAGHVSRSRREAAGHVAFSKAVLRWRLIGEGYSSQLSVEEQRYVFRLAFRMWSEVCPLEFVEDNSSPLEEIDIRLGFGTGRHLGCRQRFDGTGREFAHAWFLGDIHFDDDEHFAGPSAGRGISLLKVAVHEIGHVLGLPHIYRPGSIMEPSYRPHESGFEMDWMDRKAIQSLYGGCEGRFNTVFDWIRRDRTPRGDVVIRFNTYFMRQGWYWLYENRNNRTRFGDPVSLQSGWRGLPLDGVDAFVHVWSRRRDHAYFFKGSHFWRYDPDQDQVLRRGPDGGPYPRLISEGFPGVPAPIDTAVYDRTDGNIYFFKNRLVYAFSVDSNRLARGYPRPLRSVFPALDPRDHPESGLDAAYFSYTHNALFLFKDALFWRVAGTRDRRGRPDVPRNALLPHGLIHQTWFDICNVHATALRLNP